MKLWLKNNYGYILLAMSLFLNGYCFLYKSKTTQEVERQEMQLKIDSLVTIEDNLTIKIKTQSKEIDSLILNKPKVIYLKQKLKKKYEKGFSFYSNSNDSTRLYIWTKSVQNF